MRSTLSIRSRFSSRSTKRFRIFEDWSCARRLIVVWDSSKEAPRSSPSRRLLDTSDRQSLTSKSSKAPFSSIRLKFAELRSRPSPSCRCSGRLSPEIFCCSRSIPPPFFSIFIFPLSKISRFVNSKISSKFTIPSSFFCRLKIVAVCISSPCSRAVCKISLRRFEKSITVSRSKFFSSKNPCLLSVTSNSYPFNCSSFASSCRYTRPSSFITDLSISFSYSQERFFPSAKVSLSITK